MDAAAEVREMCSHFILLESKTTKTMRNRSDHKWVLN